MLRIGVAEEEISKCVDNVKKAFPDTLVKHCKSLVEGLNLPDEKDRHVLASAIKTNANMIVTNYLKDFPNSYMTGFGLRAISADDFLTDLIDLNQSSAVEAFRRLV